ncbi:MAG: FixH family protein [Caldilineaceae bacterium]
MTYRKRGYKFSMFALLFTLLLVLVGCSKQSDAQDNPLYLKIKLIAPPVATDKPYQIVQLTDSAGQPVTDATVNLEGNMTHAGMAPVIGDSVTDEGDGKADGHYQAPIQLDMLGDWVVTVVVNTKDGTTINQDIPVQVNEQGIKISQ